MGEYNWADMELCKKCHFGEKASDICYATGKPEKKKDLFNGYNSCVRWMPESKWNRAQQARLEYRQEYQKEFQICNGCEYRTKSNECLRAYIPINGTCEYKRTIDEI